ncbi:MAG: hypothetical protein K2O04_01000 [Clostridiales bacterium]|nr:hypothetical protein [Clostridiales bacterium]
MAIFAICPVCSKTIKIERQPKLSCPECDSQFGYAELQRKRLLIDERTERAELAAAKSFFRSGDFMNAQEHFKLALEANGNSYAAKYFVMLCDIYLHEAGDSEKYDVMSAVVDMIRRSLDVLARSNVAVADKLAFITAMLAETKIIITRRLSERDEQFNSDIDSYRKQTVSDLTKLLELFKIEREQIMSFAPEVSAVLNEILDCAIKVCYKAVQTVMIGDEIKTPNDSDYKNLLSLCNDLCFFGHSINPYFDSSPYSPDFSQNYEYNKSVLGRIKAFDENNKVNAKKNAIGDIDAYEKLLEECEKALKFTYLSCYRSMCSRQVARHAQLFFDGFDLVYRLLMPRVALLDGKRIEIRTSIFADISERCDMLTRFLVDAYELNPEAISTGLHEYYEKLYDIVSTYYVPEMDKLAKSKDRNNLYYQQLLSDCVCSCAPALKKYVDFSDETDKVRVKIVKICRSATEDFLLRAGITIDEIEQSNFYRPILQISNALVEEDNE